MSSIMFIRLWCFAKVFVPTRTLFSSAGYKLDEFQKSRTSQLVCVHVSVNKVASALVLRSVHLLYCTE